MSITSINQLELEQSRRLSGQVAGLAQEFLTACGLSYVGISKFYFNGRYLSLVSDITWKEKMVHYRFYNDFVNHLESLEIHKSKPLFSMWQAEPSSEVCILNEAFVHGFKSGFHKIAVCSDGIEFYNFGSKRGIPEVSEIIFNREELDMFCLYLRENTLQAKNRQNMVLGDMGQCFSLSSGGDKNAGYCYAPIPKSFSFSCNNQEGKLYRQQLICLGFLAKGYEYKEIARIVALSPRTVEFYIKNIKRQYHNPSTIELITAFNKSPLASVNPHMLYATKDNRSNSIQ